MNFNLERLRPWVQRHPRVAGIFMIAFGSACFYWGIYSQYLDALKHERIWLYSVGIYASLFAPLLILLGIFVTVRGKILETNKPYHPPTPEEKRQGAIWAIAIFAAWPIMSLPFCAIMGRIEALGYDVSDNPVYWVCTHVPVLHNLSKTVNRVIP